MHAASRHRTPSLRPLPKADEVSCKVRPPKSPMQTLTSLEADSNYASLQPQYEEVEKKEIEYENVNRVARI